MHPRVLSDFTSSNHLQGDICAGGYLAQNLDQQSFSRSPWACEGLHAMCGKSPHKYHSLMMALRGITSSVSLSRRKTSSTHLQWANTRVNESISQWTHMWMRLSILNIHMKAISRLCSGSSRQPFHILCGLVLPHSLCDLFQLYSTSMMGGSRLIIPQGPACHQSRQPKKAAVVQGASRPLLEPKAQRNESVAWLGSSCGCQDHNENDKRMPSCILLITQTLSETKLDSLANKELQMIWRPEESLWT